MHERLRLYDIFRVVSLLSCQHEYIRVRGNSVRNIHNGNVGGSDHNIHNGNVGSSLRSVRVRLRLLMPGCPETTGPEAKSNTNAAIATTLRDRVVFGFIVV